MREEKYRVRLLNGRIIGPFSPIEIQELYFKGHIDGRESFQLFPIGDWQPLSFFPNLIPFQKNDKKERIITVKSKDENSNVTLKVKTEIVPEPTKSDLKSFNEFKFERVKEAEVDYQELEKKYHQQKKPESVDNNNSMDSSLKKEPVKEEIEKTIINVKKSSMPTKDSTETFNQKLSSSENSSSSSNIKEPAAPVVPSYHVLVSEKTEFFNLDHFLPSINAELSASEIDLEQQERIEKNKERIRLEYTDKNQDESEPTFEKKQSKSLSVVVVISFLAILYMFLEPDEPPKASGLQYVDIVFPITREFEDKSGAAVNLNQGRNLYSGDTYLKRGEAANLFLFSLQKQFENNPALGELILTYSELLDDTKFPKLASSTIYKLIQLSENKQLTDLNVVTGTALFYNKIGKYQTGINIVKNYLRMKSPTSSKLFAYYLDLLINANDFVEAKKTFNILKGLSKKSKEAYSSMARFYELDDHLVEAREVIGQGLKYYSNSTLLLLQLADYLFKEKSFKRYEEVLQKIESNKAEGSPRHLAKYLYYKGLLSAYKNNPKEAIKYFKKSLEIKESEELRSMLSTLELSGDKLFQALVVESKILDFEKRARAELKNKNIELAFSFALKAIELSPESVPAVLLLTELQIKRGLFDSAISTLKKAVELNPNNSILKRNLAQTYIQAFKFEDAKQTLLELSQTKWGNTREYSSLMGDYYFSLNSYALAIRYYSEALNRYPLSDYDMFQIVKILLKNKKFQEAKARLLKTILLDPKNPEYISAMAEIMFEQDSTDIAIGYLRDAISEIGEQPKLISTIAIFYYRSGQIKEFQQLYKRIQDMPKKDEKFYEFLVYSARFEEKNEDIINYSNEILKMNPGDLKVRLELGEFYFQNSRYKEAIVQFDEVRLRLVSYPKVHYLLAKLYLATGEIKKAKEMSLKELELNPSLDSAYFIVGEVARIEKDYRTAVDKYEKSLSINPRSVEALMAMASIKLAQNFSNEAIELYRRALGEDKNNPEIYKQMGFSYKAAGLRALAKEKFEEYLKLNPGAADRDQIEIQIQNLN